MCGHRAERRESGVSASTGMRLGSGMAFKQHDGKG